MQINDKKLPASSQISNWGEKKKQLKPLCFKIELLSRKKIFFGQLATDFELAGNQEKKSNKFKLCDRKGNNNYFFLS